MISYFKNLKASKLNQGITYVELIVVLGIFAIMSSIVIFNYGAFQAKVDIKNLGSDIALKIVEAQKSSVSGKLPSTTLQAQEIPGWKPSYGVYFDTTTPTQFNYFVDLDQDNYLADPGCSGNSECLDRITITKGSISQIEQYIGTTHSSVSPLSVTFKRPNSGAFFKYNNTLLGVDYIQITVVSSRSPTATAKIKIFPSGRIQVD